MKTKLMVAFLCAGGLAMLAPPALAQPRGRGGPEDGPRAAAAEPAAREQAMEQQIRELQMQLKRLQEEVAGSQPKPEARPQAADGERRGPVPAARRPEAQAQAPEGRFAGPEGGPGMMDPLRGGRGGGRGGMAGGMAEQSAPQQARAGRGGPPPFAERPEGPAVQQGPRGAMMGRRPAFGRNEQQTYAGPQNALAQIRQLLEEARTMIARAEQLLAQQAPRGPAGRGLAQQRPNARQDGRDDPQGPDGRDRFAPPPAGRDGRMGPGPMGYQAPGAGRPGPQGPPDGGPRQRGGGPGQGFRGGRGGPGPDGGFGGAPGPRGEGRFGPPRPYDN